MCPTCLKAANDQNKQQPYKFITVWKLSNGKTVTFFLKDYHDVTQSNIIDITVE
jgi:hypothetical protein